MSGPLRLALLSLAFAATAACVHTPQPLPAAPPPTLVNGSPPVTDNKVSPPAVAAPSVSAPQSPVAPAGAAPADTTSSAGAAPEPALAAVPGANAATPPPIPPARYADLFDRMRAGFKLEDTAGRTAVDQELRWYVANPDYLQRAFGRADLYLYHIVTELEARGMPLELALLPVVESAFEPYAYSRARASGLWQFIPGTGSRYGLKQDWWYDGRRDIVESTRAALDYLQSLHDEFGGDWLLAIAAYNCGEAIVERSVEANRSAGRSIDFWSLWLPHETRTYVPKLLAMQRLVRNPGLYGLTMSPIPNQPYFARVATGGQISMKVAGEIANVSPEELYELNPAFHRWATDPDGPYYLLLPVDAADVFASSVEQLNADQRLGVTHYSVGHGDSVVSVAAKFHTTVNVIRELNDFPNGRLSIGQDLRVPSTVPELPAKVILAAARIDGRDRAARRPHVLIARRGDSLWTIARRHGMNVDTLAKLNGMQPDDPLTAGQRIQFASSGSDSGHSRRVRRLVYTVREGDTMAQIAQLFQCSAPEIRAWNGLGAHSPIHAGQKLRIHLVRRS
jgi:membrane-bound lytic murein transglycosylase D